MIITEPGIYSAEIGGGVRYEDDAVVTADGAVVLATTELPVRPILTGMRPLTCNHSGSRVDDHAR